MNSKYIIDCTGDAVKGDKVIFKKDFFKGSWRRPKYSHSKVVEGEIINDSYGKEKQQHTFTILLTDGTKKLIKGRNLYKHYTYRQPWDDEEQRKAVQEEKHLRGALARELRDFRKGIYK